MSNYYFTSWEESKTQYPVAQLRKRLRTQTLNEGFSSITLQSVLVFKGTKKRTLDSIELTIITKLRKVIQLNNGTQCKKTLKNWIMGVFSFSNCESLFWKYKKLKNAMMTASNWRLFNKLGGVIELNIHASAQSMETLEIFNMLGGCFLPKILQFLSLRKN